MIQIIVMSQLTDTLIALIGIGKIWPQNIIQSVVKLFNGPINSPTIPGVKAVKTSSWQFDDKVFLIVIPEDLANR